jgi:hypothetical protein
MGLDLLRRAEQTKQRLPRAFQGECEPLPAIHPQSAQHLDFRSIAPALLLDTRFSRPLAT